MRRRVGQRNAGGFGSVALVLMILGLAAAGGGGIYFVSSGQLPAAFTRFFPNLFAGGSDVELATSPAARATAPDSAAAGSPAPDSPPLAEMPPLVETNAAAAPDTWPELAPAALLDQAAANPDRGLKDTAFDQPPWRRYARPFAPPPDRPLFGILLTGLGADRAVTAAAIAGLPADVTLSFNPYAPELAAWIAAARAFGHEAMIDLPLQAKDFPARDPGPLAVLLALNDGEIARRIDALSGSGDRAFGLAGDGGSALLLDDRATGAALGEIARLGLAFVDTSTEPMSRAASASADAGGAFFRVALRLDEAPTQAAIAERLAVAAQLADQQGRVLAMARASPVAITVLADWARRLTAQGPVLAPVSALMAK